MKTFQLVSSLATFAVAVSAHTNSTVTCPECHPASSTPDVVTREPIPSTSCDAPELTTVPAMATSVVTTTNMYTITSCPPTVTDCPVGSVTSTIESYTTVCPVSPTGGPAPPSTWTTMPGGGGVTPIPTGGIPSSPGAPVPTPIPAGAPRVLVSFTGVVAAVAAIVCVA